MQSADDTAALVAAALAGDRVAAGTLVERMRGFAYLVARRYHRRHTVPLSVDDLAAAGLVGVLHATARFDPGRAGGRAWLVYDPAAPAGEVWLAHDAGTPPARAWLTYARAACAREIAREARRQAARALPSDAGLAGASSADPEQLAERHALADRVRAAVAALPRRQRLLVEAVHGLRGAAVTVEVARRPLRLTRRQAIAHLQAGRDALRGLLGV